MSMKCRSFCLAAALTALAMFMAGSTIRPLTALAQADSCCLRVVNDTRCDLTICVRLSNGDTRCVTLDSNSRRQFAIPCDADARFLVRDACGADRLIPNDCIVVPLAGHCCARVCLTRIEGCIVITATQVDGPCPC